MVFSSLIFVFCFFVLHFAAMALAPTLRAKNAVLLVSSLIFYMWGGAAYLVLICGMVFINYIGSIATDKAPNMYYRRAFMIITVAADLLLLAYFKYTGFLASNLHALIGIPSEIPQIALPIGISFYTFQLLSYTVDVYRRDVPAQKNYFLLLMYTTSFHQCIAGPIVRYADVNDELLCRTVKASELSDGIMRFSVGFAKKAILANTCATIADKLLPYDTAALKASSATALMLGTAAYMLQIYFDFSAYSDMAIGMGLMTGFHYKENFNYPYTATSVTDFWRRWHMSLSSFFRDYVYIPLGGSRVSKGRHMFNLFAVWFLTGMWHGASWNFIFWGLYFLVFLLFEKFVLKLDTKNSPRPVMQIPRRLYLLVVIFFSWILFRFSDLSMLWATVRGIFCLNGNSFTDPSTTLLFKNYVFLLVFAALACTPLYKKIVERAAASYGKHLSVAYNVWMIVSPIILIFFSFTSLVGDSYNPFIYFNF